MADDGLRIDFDGNEALDGLDAFNRQWVQTALNYKKVDDLTIKYNRSMEAQQIIIREMRDEYTKLITTYEDVEGTIKRTGQTFIVNEKAKAKVAKDTADKIIKENQRWIDEQIAQERRIQNEHTTDRAKELTALKNDITERSNIQRRWADEQIAQERRIQNERDTSRAKELAALKADIIARSEISAKRGREFLQTPQSRRNAGLVGGGGSIGSTTIDSKFKKDYLDDLKEQIRLEKIQRGEIKDTSGSLLEQIFSWRTLARVAAIHLLYRGMGLLNDATVRSVQSTIELQKSLAELQTISLNFAGNSESAYKWLRAATDVSNEFGTSLESNIAAAYEALSNQVIDNTTEFRVFQEEVNKFAITTGTDTANAVNLLSSYLNAFQLDISHTSDVAAQLFKTIDLGRVRADEMANSIGRILVPANELGVSMGEINSLIATATIRGIKFSEAQTQIRGVLTKLIKPTEEGAKFLNSIGVESGKAAIQAYGLAGVFQLLSQYTDDSQESLARIFPEVRGLNLALLLQGKGLDAAATNFEKITNASADYARAFDYSITNSGKLLEIELTKIKNIFTTEVGPEVLETIKNITLDFKLLEPSVRVVGKTLKAAAIAVTIYGIAKAVTVLTEAVTILGIRGAASYALLANPIVLTLATTATAVAIVDYALGSVERKQKAIFQAGLEASITIDKLNIKRQQDLDLLIQTENKYLDERYRLYNNSAATITQFLNKEIEERQTLEKKLLESIKDSAEQTINRIGELASKTKTKLDEVTDGIKTNSEALRKIAGTTSNTLFDWELEGKKAKQQFDIIQRRIEGLRRERQQAITAGNSKLFEDDTKAIDDLLKKQHELVTNGEKDASKTGRGPKIQEQLQALSRKRQTLSEDLDNETNDARRRKLSNQLREVDAKAAALKTQLRSIKNDRSEDVDISKQQLSAQRAYVDAKREEIQLRQQLLQIQKAEQRALDRQLEDQNRRKEEFKAATDSLQEFGKRKGFDFNTKEIFSKDKEIIKQQSLVNTLPVTNSADRQAAVDQLERLEQDRFALQGRVIQAEFDKQDKNLALLREGTRQTYADLYNKKLAILGEVTNPQEKEEELRRLNAIAAEGAKKLYDIDLARKNLQEQSQLELLKNQQEAATDNRNKTREDFLLRQQAARERFKQANDELVNLQKGIEFLRTQAKSTDETTSATSRTGIVQALKNLPSFALGGGIDFATDSKNLSGITSSIDNQIANILTVLQDKKAEELGRQDFLDLKKNVDEIISKVGDQSNFSQDQQGVFDGLVQLDKDLQTFIDNGGQASKDVVQSKKDLEDLAKERKENAALEQSPQELFAESVDTFKVAIESLTKFLKEKFPTAQGLALGGRVKGYAMGGLAPSDTVPAMLSPGEFVVRSQPTEKFLAQLMHMNYGLNPSAPASNSGTQFSFGDINVDASNTGGNPDAIANAVIEKINFRVRHGVR